MRTRIVSCSIIGIAVYLPRSTPTPLASISI